MVTETNTTARPAPNGPPGLEGGVTLTHPITNTGGQTMMPKLQKKRKIQQEYGDLGMSWDEVKRTAKNWVRLKAAVEALCSSRSEED